MIKEFHIEDLGYFLPNQFSDPDNVLPALKDNGVVKLSLWHNDMVAAILVFRNYWGSCWEGFFLICENFPVRCAMDLKRYIDITMRRLDATRLQTDSVACDVLNRWHEFLGFKLEGTREKLMHERDYNMFARVRVRGA